MKRVSRILLLPAILAGALAASATEIQVIGSGTVNVSSGSPGDVRARATIAAKNRAVTMAIDRVLGPGASLNPTVAPKVDAVVSQIPESSIINTSASRVGNDYEVKVTLVIDDKQFRELLSDLGIAINTAANRSHALLAVMDEFLTSPREVHAPVEELEEFRHEAGGSFKDTSTSKSSEKSSAHASSAANAHVHGGGAAGGFVASDSMGANSSSSDSQANNVASDQHDNTYYKKLIRYQPQGGSPEKVNQTYNALTGELQDFDLRMVDNDLFRSKYFKNKPITIEEMEKSEELAKYVGFAKTEASADFFMVGTSIIIDSGFNQATGEQNCSGVVTLKTYSTGNGESIASETTSEVAAGSDLNNCAGNVAKKLARIAAASVGKRVQDYWKRRATYGREYVVTLLTPQNLPLMVRLAFTRAVAAIPGVENSTARSSTEKQVQLVVTYKGSDPIDQAIATNLMSNPSFATLDAQTEGTQVTLCMGPCSAVLKH